MSEIFKNYETNFARSPIFCITNLFVLPTSKLCITLLCSLFNNKCCRKLLLNRAFQTFHRALLNMLIKK